MVVLEDVEGSAVEVEAGAEGSKEKSVGSSTTKSRY